MSAPTPPPLWDARAAWRALMPEQQERIGVAALVATCAWLRWDDPSNSGFDVGWEAAEVEGPRALVAAFQEAIAADPALGRPDLAAIDVRACRVCGCADEVGCPDGCSWVEENLCSACVSAP